MKNVIILGAGLIGKTMAIDLAAKYKVTCADIRQESLNDFPPRLKISTTVCDFTHKKKLAGLLQPFDLVILAIPGFMGFDTLKTVIEAGKNVVDISFFPEDPFKLNELAVKKNVAAIVDCGVAPGMCNIIAVLSIMSEFCPVVFLHLVQGNAFFNPEDIPHAPGFSLPEL